MKTIFILALFLGASLASAQQPVVRIDPQPATTVATNVGQGGYPPVLSLGQVSVQICNAPINGFPCTNFATTYTDASGATICPSTEQVVVATGTVCSSTADATGNFGFWIAPGNFFYQINVNGTMYGPYPVTASVGAVQIPTISQITPQQFGAIADGHTDDSAAMTAWAAYLDAHPCTAGYMPAGKYMMNGTITLHSGTTIKGDGMGISDVIETNPFKDLWVQYSTAFCQAVGWPEGPVLSDFTLGGQGHLTTGNLLVNNSANQPIINRVAFVGHGGRAMFLQAERGQFSDLHFSDVRQAIGVNNAAAINETYLTNFTIMQPGRALDDIGTSGDTTDYCYDVNCVNGVFPASGALVQEDHAAINFGTNSTNIHIENGSIKPTIYAAGIKESSGSLFWIQNVYCEGFFVGAVNPCLIVGGKSEATTTSGSTANTATSINMLNGSWFPYVSNIADAQTNNMAYVIRPPDYVLGSSVSSSIGGGILKGDFEYVLTNTVLHDGNGTGWHLNATGRGQFGTTAKTWPAGAVVEEGWQGVNDRGATLPFPGPIEIVDTHFQGIQNDLGPYTLTIDPTLGDTGGEIVIGLVPDAFFWTGTANVKTAGQESRSINLMGHNQAFCGGPFGHSTPASGAIDSYTEASIGMTPGASGINDLGPTSATIGGPGDYCGGIIRHLVNGFNTQLSYSDTYSQVQALGPLNAPASVAYSSVLAGPNYPGPGIVGLPGSGSNVGLHLYGYSGTPTPAWDMWINGDAARWKWNGVDKGSVDSTGLVSAGNAFRLPDIAGYSGTGTGGGLDLISTAKSGHEICVTPADNQGPSPSTGGGFGNQFCALMPQLLNGIPNSATPVFDLSSSTALVFTLTQNVTSSTTLVGATTIGKTFTADVLLCQDSIGGWTMVWPTNVVHANAHDGVYAPTIPAAAHACLAEKWTTNNGGADWITP